MKVSLKKDTFFQDLSWNIKKYSILKVRIYAILRVEKVFLSS